MPPVWTDLATAAALVNDGDLVTLCGHTRAAPTGYPGYYPQDEVHIALYLRCSKGPATFTDYLNKYVLSKKINKGGT
ncbi:MAG: hypothetical protein A2139_05160 [Desulfobacca sp. RBG_16_60_12]|nr:MAG: hypothetical protein A2139_05160 [Desulfobacca sp. RBG_16_60_12]